MSAEANDGPSAVKRFGPLAVFVLLAQLGIAWVLIQALLVPAEHKEPAGDEMMTQSLMGQVEQRSDAEIRGDLPYYYAPDPLNRIAVNPAGTNGERVMVAWVQLGLRAYDRSGDTPKDITSTLTPDAEMLATLDPYASRMRAIINRILGRRTVEELQSGGLDGVGEEARQALNHDVVRPAFPRETADKYLTIVEVVFTQLIIQ